MKKRDIDFENLTNDDFKIVYQPKTNASVGAVVKRRRFGVGLQSLCNYIGESNAVAAIQQALKTVQEAKIRKPDSQKGRARVKFRKAGIVDFYLQ